MSFKDIDIRNSRFIFNTNFEGNPEKDRFRSPERKGNLIIPDKRLAREMMDEKFNVKMTKPRPGYEEDFEPEYYISVKMNFKSRRPPKIMLVDENGPMPLTEDTVSTIDILQENHAIKNVNALCNVYHNNDRDSNSLYVSVMYVEQDVERDPYADLYSKTKDTPEEDDLPF